jgi:hypothetical protein
VVQLQNGGDDRFSFLLVSLVAGEVSYVQAVKVGGVLWLLK